MKEYEIMWAFSTHGELKRAHRHLIGNLEGRDRFGEFNVDGS
jgi:hypothetical protein